jgi:hypothetical protein
MTTITKIKTTNNFHPALGKLFIITLSNGKLFEIYSEELISKFCYNDGYDDDKIAKMESKDFIDIIGERWD